MRARTLNILIAGFFVVTTAEAAAVRLHKKARLRVAAVRSNPTSITMKQRSRWSTPRLVLPAPMKGSTEILIHQNVMADQEGLSRIQDDDDLDDMRESKLLVAIPKGQGIQTDERLPENRRYCRPWTAQFLTALAKAHYAKFHHALQVNSAVRTVEFQERLLRTNGNAAPAEGQTASPHLTGQAVDLAKKGLSVAEVGWLRGYLLPLVKAGKVDVEEEFQQSCFHVSVYKGFEAKAKTKAKAS